MNDALHANTKKVAQLLPAIFIFQKDKCVSRIVRNNKAIRAQFMIVSLLKMKFLGDNKSSPFSLEIRNVQVIDWPYSIRTLKLRFSQGSPH